jgi:hypothetical protein
MASSPCDKRGLKTHPLTSTKQSAGSQRSGRVKRCAFKNTIDSYSACIKPKLRSTTFEAQWCRLSSLLLLMMMMTIMILTVAPVAVVVTAAATMMTVIIMMRRSAGALAEAG